MNEILKNRAGKIVMVIIAVIILSSLVFAFWYSAQPKFKDVTMELGDELPGIEAFTTNFAIRNRCEFVTPIESINLKQAGEQRIILKQSIHKETVVLRIVDTVAPVVEFCDGAIRLGDTLTPELFVKSVEDLSETQVRFAVEPNMAEDYMTDSVEVIVADISGNEVRKVCNITYTWIVPSYTMELGESLQKGDLRPLLQDDEKMLSKEWINSVNASGVGAYTFSSVYKEKEFDISVIVQDTTAPVLEVHNVKAFLQDNVAVEDFIVSVTDISGECVLSTDIPLTTDAVGVKTVTITATDASGNQTSATAEFEVIADTEAPVLSGLEQLRVELGTQIDYMAGVSATDNRDEELTISYESASVNIEKPGTYYVQYICQDRAGNKAELRREILVVEDCTAPVFSGLTDIAVEKNGTPNYTKGVSAVDNRDGSVEFTYDTSKLNLTKAGTYYITYTAADKAGNIATARRKVVVNYDSSDTDLLVADIASKLSSDPEEIRDYVRNTIAYNRYWGGDNPVWYGFKNKVGNCYVHALCLQALFNEKGIENMLIWDTDKSHYWNLVKIDGQWKHIDSTPSRPHTTYSLMNDKQRYESLISGNWDRSQWPVCN